MLQQNKGIPYVWQRVISKILQAVSVIGRSATPRKNVL